MIPFKTQIRKEDIPDADSWIVRIIDPLNRFMQDVFSILDGKVGSDNLEQEIREVTISDNDFPYTISTEIEQPKACELLYINEDTDKHVSIASAVYLDWDSENQKEVTIYNIVGISASTDYNIRVRIS